MRKYYTRACNFYHGSEATRLIQTKKALPLNGKNNIAFDSIEIFSREKRGVKVNLININKISIVTILGEKTIDIKMKVIK